MKFFKLILTSTALVATLATNVNSQPPPGPVTRGEAKSKVTIAQTTPAPQEPEYRELRCRGAYDMRIRTGEWYPSSAGEPMMQMIVTFSPVYKPTDSWGANLRSGECAFADWTMTGAKTAEIHQVIVAFGQLKQKLKGTELDTSPTAAERFPDARNVPEYLQNSENYWSFFVRNTGRGYLEASYGRFWKPARKLSPGDIRKGPRIVPP